MVPLPDLSILPLEPDKEESQMSSSSSGSSNEASIEEATQENDFHTVVGDPCAAFYSEAASSTPCQGGSSRRP